MMKQHRAEMRDAVDSAAKEAMAGFTEAANAAVEEAVIKVRSESEMRRTREVKEAASVNKDNDCRRKAQEEKEETSSYV